ncbi:6-hydroxymethylpterin diphosphokinase MptE-like protein [Pseudocalidococcus azoricus]|nr:6-hydroxymethylpterin diphosphokinase MptE-like protein [Pseudocalidococcus azoricus]
MVNNPFSYQRKSINPYRSFLRSCLEVSKRVLWDIDPLSWESRTQLLHLKDKYVNEKAVIICNGPSLLKSNLSNLNGIYTFGLNKINLLFDKSSFRPSSIVCVDPIIFYQNLDFFKTTEIPLFLAHEFSKSNLQHNNNIYIYSSFLNTFSFAQDCSWNIGNCGTVTYTALQLALHMGFRDVAIIGCDHSYKTRKTFGSIEITAEKDINHFHPNYTKSGDKWQVSNIAGMELGYSIAKAAYEFNNGRIINCTEGGYLETFPRMSLEDWLVN